MNVKMYYNLAVDHKSIKYLDRNNHRPLKKNYKQIYICKL